MTATSVAGAIPAPGRRRSGAIATRTGRGRVGGVIVVGSLAEAIRRHELWLWRELRSGCIPLERMAELDGETLGCWCHQPGPCHGHTLVRAAAWAAAQLQL